MVSGDAVGKQVGLLGSSSAPMSAILKRSVDCGSPAWTLKDVIGDELESTPLGPSARGGAEINDSNIGYISPTPPLNLGTVRTGAVLMLHG